MSYIKLSKLSNTPKVVVVYIDLNLILYTIVIVSLLLKSFYNSKKFLIIYLVVILSIDKLSRIEGNRVLVLILVILL